MILKNKSTKVVLGNVVPEICCSKIVLPHGNWYQLRGKIILYNYYCDIICSVYSQKTGILLSKDITEQGLLVRAV